MPTVAEIRFADVIDILIVSGLCWAAIVWIRGSRARVALGGVAATAILFLVSDALGLRVTTSVLKGFVALSALVLVIVFQDDLRRFFEGITLWVMRRATPRPASDLLDELGSLCFAFAHERVGALLVLPGREPLERLLDGGQFLDGRASVPLLRSLFDPRTPGHDGAIVIRGSKITRFGVHLPLSTEWEELGAGGTRHAAALGLAERSDALCIVVSEERGEVSVASRGHLERFYDEDELRAKIDRFLRRTARRRGENWWQARLLGARHHWREGVLASALAVGLWLHSVPGSVLDQSSKAIPVVVENLPDGYRVMEIDPPEIDVIFEGKKRDLVLAGDAELQIRIDGDLAR